MRKTNKELIYKTAFKLFLARHYEAVSMKDLEKETLLTKGAFYHYVTTKEELFCSVIKEYGLDKQRIHNKIDIDKCPSLYDFICEYISGVEKTMKEIQHILGDIPLPKVNKAYLSLGLYAGDYYNEFDKLLNEIFQEEIDIWKSVIEKAHKAGEIQKDTDVVSIAEIFRYIHIGQSYIEALSVGLNTEHLKKQLMCIYNLIKV